MMLAFRYIFVLLTLSTLCICSCKAGTQTPPTPITTLDAAQGGKIVYGTVDGASTQAEAMSHVLRVVHNNCGEKPQIGKVFQFKGTKTVGVFFTVTNHAQNNTPVAGLVISAASGPHQVDAALVSDKASRFGKTVNPMLQQLFGVWQPGGQAAASSSAFNGKTAPAGGGESSSGPAQLRTVTLRDNSASVGVPDGWQVDSSSAGGSILVKGPHKEMIYLNSAFTANDPRDPGVRQGIMLQRQYGHGQPDNKIYLQYGSNLPQAFITFFHFLQQNSHLPLSTIQISSSSQIPGKPCERLEGTVSGGSLQGAYKVFGVLCEQPPQSGIWMSSLYMSLLPDSVAAQERATAQAVLSSFHVNAQVVNAQAAAYAAPAIEAIHAIGQQAAADRATRNAGYDAQHDAYWAQQHNNAAQHSNWSAGQDGTARNNQGFNNYLLDQSVVQGNDIDGTGAVGHATVWNSTADALVKYDPNRFEIVDTSNYWKGTDY
jgi:hypothetical protein